MRLHWVGIALVLALVSQSAAQDAVGSASGALDAAGGRGRWSMRSANDLNGSNSLTIPSPTRSGGQRGIGANFSSRTEASLSDRGGRNRVDVDIDASARGSHRGTRKQKPKPPSHYAEPRAERKKVNGANGIDRDLLQADLQLAHRLAEIDRLRDHALAHDDVDLLMRADVLEQQARDQHQQHIEQMRLADRANAAFDVEHEARGASYEQSNESSEVDEDASREAAANEIRHRAPARMLNTESEAEFRGEFSSSSMPRPRPRMSAPRATRVMTEPEVERQFGATYDATGTVRAADADN